MNKKRMMIALGVLGSCQAGVWDKMTGVLRAGVQGLRSVRPVMQPQVRTLFTQQQPNLLLPRGTMAPIHAMPIRSFVPVVGLMNAGRPFSSSYIPAGKKNFSPAVLGMMMSGFAVALCEADESNGSSLEAQLSKLTSKNKELVTNEDGTVDLQKALERAIIINNVDLLKALLEEKKEEVFIGKPNELGFTPLDIAVAQGKTELVEVLVVHATSNDINAVSGKQGDTVLIRAARLGWTKIVKLLVEAGADSTVVNKAGKRALDVAKNDAIKQILEGASFEQIVKLAGLQEVEAGKRLEIFTAFVGQHDELRSQYSFAFEFVGKRLRKEAEVLQAKLDAEKAEQERLEKEQAEAARVKAEQEIQAKADAEKAAQEAKEQVEAPSLDVLIAKVKAAMERTGSTQVSFEEVFTTPEEAEAFRAVLEAEQGSKIELVTLLDFVRHIENTMQQKGLKEANVEDVLPASLVASYQALLQKEQDEAARVKAEQEAQAKADAEVKAAQEAEELRKQEEAKALQAKLDAEKAEQERLEKEQAEAARVKAEQEAQAKADSGVKAAQEAEEEDEIMFADQAEVNKQ